MQVVEVPSPPRRTRNAAATRAHILAVAQTEFVAHGLSGARMDRIAETCAVNKNLLYHYFGSKEDLYLAVIEGIWAGLRANQRDEELLALLPEQASVVRTPRRRSARVGRRCASSRRPAASTSRWPARLPLSTIEM